MSQLKKRVCKIIKGAGLGEATPDDIIINCHRSDSAEGFWINPKCVNDKGQSYNASYHTVYTLTEFVKTFRRCGNPSLIKRNELYFENDRDGKDCRYAGWIGL